MACQSQEIDFPQEDQFYLTTQWTWKDLKFRDEHWSVDVHLVEIWKHEKPGSYRVDRKTLTAMRALADAGQHGADFHLDAVLALESFVNVDINSTANKRSRVSTESVVLFAEMES